MIVVLLMVIMVIQLDQWDRNNYITEESRNSLVAIMKTSRTDQQ